MEVYVLGREVGEQPLFTLVYDETPKSLQMNIGNVKRRGFKQKTKTRRETKTKKGVLSGDSAHSSKLSWSAGQELVRSRHQNVSEFSVPFHCFRSTSSVRAAKGD